jgi:hypothetical protein
MTAADPLSRQGAELLAARLRSFWGSGVRVLVVEENFQLKKQGHSSIWIVRSDLVGGKPRADCAARGK